MTRSLRLENGDLAVKSSRAQLVSGEDKLKQDLDCWLKENFGSDRFHPLYGSVLDQHIGGVINNDTAFFLKSEVLRVLTNYQQLQLRRVRANPALFSPQQLLDEIVSVGTSSEYDRINVVVTYRTAKGTVGQIGMSVGV